MLNNAIIQFPWSITCFETRLQTRLVSLTDDIIDCASSMDAWNWNDEFKEEKKDVHEIHTAYVLLQTASRVLHLINLIQVLQEDEFSSLRAALTRVGMCSRIFSGKSQYCQRVFTPVCLLPQMYGALVRCFCTRHLSELWTPNTKFPSLTPARLLTEHFLLWSRSWIFILHVLHLALMLRRVAEARFILSDSHHRDM